MTAEHWHDHLVRLALVAWDRAAEPGANYALNRRRFEIAVRERMAQAAQGIAGLEVTTCEDVREHVRGCAYCGGDR